MNLRWLNGGSVRHAFVEGQWKRSLCGVSGGSCFGEGGKRMPRCPRCVRILESYR